MRQEEIEAAARAMFAAQGHDPDSDWSEWKPNLPEPEPEPAWTTCRGEARAAILAVDRVRADAAPAPLPEDVKAAAGAKKPRLDLVPPVFKMGVALAMGYGALKYEAWDFRGANSRPIRASVYVAAMHRHLDA